ncbi:MAG: GNAT family N-acetyltransferase [Parcubacteria group bacterium]|nr:GNAT family N-acetyltransferase [Parcubacteria group bacterium]
MEIKKKKIDAYGIKFYVEENGKEVGRAYLYVMTNDLHEEPFGFMEDVYVDESLRGQGTGTQLVEALLAEAKKIGCYKLIATSRYERERVHQLYGRLGFKDHGKEFRLDF